MNGRISTALVGVSMGLMAVSGAACEKDAGTPATQENDPSLATAKAPALPDAGAEPMEFKGLKNAASFASIEPAKARAVALFEEAGKVMQHPRCVNCHPAGDRPLQNDDMAAHEPPVVRGGLNGHGVAGMRCQTCHTGQNVDLGDRSVPGHEPWHLAPIEMAWEGKTLGEICVQLKDPTRNGDRDLAAIIDHSANDGLVGWGWDPGRGRTPAPGDQATFGGLIAAWVDAGAHCPE